MSTSLNDYFAAEAGEYLDQLERLSAAPAVRDGAQLLRLVRAVRGAAELARHPQIASVAARLEAAAAGAAEWDEALRTRFAWTVSDLQALVRASATWGLAEDMRVHAALRRWDDASPAEAPAGVAPRQAPAPAAEDGVPSIVRFFHDDAGPHVLDAPAAAGAVPIESLLLRGDAALAAALALRPEAERLLAAAGAPELRAVLDEVWELVQLGRHPA